MVPVPYPIISYLQKYIIPTRNQQAWLILVDPRLYAKPAEVFCYSLFLLTCMLAVPLTHLVPLPIPHHVINATSPVKRFDYVIGWVMSYWALLFWAFNSITDGWLDRFLAEKSSFNLFIVNTICFAWFSNVIPFFGIYRSRGFLW